MRSSSYPVDTSTLLAAIARGPIVAIGDTVYFRFAANNTAGSGAPGTTPVIKIFDDTIAASANPVDSITPSLRTGAGAPAGAYVASRVVSVANGYAAGKIYSAYCTLLVDAQNPTGYLKSFIT